MRQYITSNYIPKVTSADLDSVLTLYPGDIIAGSPFDTGILNAITPQFKRLAAMQGDLVFQAPRRFFLEQTSGKQNTWAFCKCCDALDSLSRALSPSLVNKRLKALPALGSVRGCATTI